MIVFALLLIIPESLGVLEDPYAYLAINAQARTFRNETMIRRRLEVNFINCANINAQVAIYAQEDQPILIINPDEHPDEFYVTDIELPYVPTELLGYEEKCVFPYHVRVEEVITKHPLTDSRCLKIRPNWMSKHSTTLGNARFSDLMLVFTHDSAAYKYESRSFYPLSKRTQ